MSARGVICARGIMCMCARGVMCARDIMCARAVLSARRLVAALGLTALLAAGVAGPAAAAPPRASFNDLEDEVMCVSCNVPLNIAESPQADRTRAAIHRLIDRGLTKQQVKDQLVRDYGEQILADPPTDGFNVTSWLVPAGVVGGLLAIGLALLPRWRRSARAAAATGAVAPAGPALEAADARRLDEDLARYDA